MKSRKKIKKSDDQKLVGASVFPVELFKPDDRPLTSLHPWACSLRTKGFRGRHRCGVTLLSGKKCTVNYVCCMSRYKKLISQLVS